MKIIGFLLFVILLSMEASTAYGLEDKSDVAIGPEDIKEFIWSETKSCVPLVELDCPEIVGFLRDYIFPIYKKNNGNKDYDRIYLKISDVNDTETKFCITLYINDKKELGETDYTLRGGYKYSAAMVDDFCVIIMSKKSCPFVKKKTGKICFKAVTQLYINDACVKWFFELKSGELVFLDFMDWGISWFKNLREEQYIPGFKRRKPTKKVYNHKRKFSIFRVAGISTPPWLPDSMKINRPYHGK